VELFMFDRILIANRGEIALRVMRACRALGISPVAVYSEADAGARHVLEADEAVLLGPPPAAASYLNIPAILEAARQSGAQAIHPGYGFLSENADFARQCQEAGLVFIGPPVEAIRKMGDKVAARNLMAAAGVPIVPGTAGYLNSDPAELAALAEQVGYPLLIKAAAGGGGIGMIQVAGPEKFITGMEQAQRRAQQAFGNPALYLERYIQQPRHIEVQLLGDQYGHLIHLFERECSVQRRHQKVVEETPSPAVDPETRQKITEAALAAGRAVGYYNAGTVEFVMGQDRQFYFLEMNTRIQVEHPITELATGVDLIQEQIKIAAGERLSLRQSDLTQGGHAIECRIYAEDPVNFYPSPGTITTYQEPSGEHIRVDAWVQSGTVVTHFYDPLLAKLVVWGQDRAEAIARTQEALNQFKVEGIKNNVVLHQKIMAQPAFASGNYDVSLLSKSL
jgi:acetyl-CoA carboxylase biotin carboxylase subunit